MNDETSNEFVRWLCDTGRLDPDDERGRAMALAINASRTRSKAAGISREEASRIAVGEAIVAFREYELGQPIETWERDQLLAEVRDLVRDLERSW